MVLIIGGLNFYIRSAPLTVKRKEELGKKLNEPGRQKLVRYNSWQQAKHAQLYSSLLQPTPDLMHRTFYTSEDLNFCIRSTSQPKNWREGSGEKKKVEYTGKVKMNGVEFLPLDEKCEAIVFLLQS